MKVSCFQRREGQSLSGPSLSHAVCLAHTRQLLLRTTVRKGEKRVHSRPPRDCLARSWDLSTQETASQPGLSRAYTGDFKNLVSIMITRLALQGGTERKEEGTETLQREQLVFSHPILLGQKFNKATN